MGWLARSDRPHGENLRTAMILGSVLASHCVEGFSYDALRGLDLARIQARFDAFARLSDFSRAELG